MRAQGAPGEPGGARRAQQSPGQPAQPRRAQLSQPSPAQPQLAQLRQPSLETPKPKKTIEKHRFSMKNIGKPKENYDFQ